MKLSTLFDEKHILFQFEGAGFVEAIRSIVEVMRDDLVEDCVDGVVESVLRREFNRPTAVFEGAAICHLRTEKVGAFRVGLIVPGEPIPHPAVGVHPLRMIFLILAPRDQNTLMLQTMSALARLLSLQTFVSSVKDVRGAGRLIRLIEESGVEVKLTLCASDIMEPIETSLELDTPITEAVQALAKCRDEGIPVLDAKGHLVGELTTREILLAGMPKYMDLLSNPEMLKSFEPFENYFANERDLHVRDICRRDFPVLPPSAPVVRVAHLMITENRRRIYILQDERIEGIIYRKSILTKVMCH